MRKLLFGILIAITLIFALNVRDVLATSFVEIRTCRVITIERNGPYEKEYCIGGSRERFSTQDIPKKCGLKRKVVEGQVLFAYDKYNYKYNLPTCGEYYPFGKKIEITVEDERDFYIQYDKSLRIGKLLLSEGTAGGTTSLVPRRWSMDTGSAIMLVVIYLVFSIVLIIAGVWIVRAVIHKKKGAKQK